MPTQQVPVMPSVVVQILITEWNKSGRGGPPAVERAKIPLGLLVPHHELSNEENAIVHQVTWRTWKENATLEPTCQGALIRDRLYDIKAVRLQIEEDQLLVRWTASNVGMPERSFLEGKNERRLKDGQWVRVRWNGRFTDQDTGNWWYEAVTANISYFRSRRPESNLFLYTQPDCEIDRMAKLL